jgi:hypothetical protein
LPVELLTPCGADRFLVILAGNLTVRDSYRPGATRAYPISESSTGPAPAEHALSRSG